MTPQELVAALLNAPDAAARQSLLPPHGDDFYAAVIALLKDKIDEERLRNPVAALALADIADEVARYANTPRCRAVAAWARGNVLIHQGEYHTCLYLYHQAVDFFTAAGAEVEAARLLTNQAWVYKNLGRYRDGIEAAQAALERLRSHPPSSFTAGVYNALGVLYRLQGRHEEALQAFEQGGQVLAALDKPVEQARLHINKANALENLDRFREARALLEQARATLADHGCTLEVARADLNLGILHTRLGRFDEALAALDRAEAGFAALDNEVEQAVVGLYRADLYAAFNLYDDLLQTVILEGRVFEERQMQWQVARTRLLQATAWRKLGDPLQAAKTARLAQAAFTRLGDPVGVQLAALEIAAQACADGRWSAALPLAGEAAAFFRRQGMPLRAAAADLLAAQSHLELGQTTQAAALYKEALTLSGEWAVPALRCRALHGLGRVAEREGRDHEADHLYHKAIETIENHRRRLQVEEFRLGFVEDKIQIYRDAVLLCLRLDRMEEAFALVERAKSGALVDLLLASLGEQPSPADEEIRPLLDRLRTLAEELDWHYSRLSMGSESPSRGGAQIWADQELPQRVAALEGEIRRLWRQVQRQSPFYTALDPMDLGGVDALRHNLLPGEVLIQYFETGETIQVFVLDRSGIRTCLSLPSMPSQVHQTVEALETTLRSVPGLDDSYVEHILAPLCDQQLGWLYEDLLAPLAPWIEGQRRLLIAPDGLLFDVPFHALHDGQGYLLDRFEIVQVPSVGTLRLCRRHWQQRPRGAKGALLVGYAGERTWPYIEQEIEAVARAVPGAVVLNGQEITPGRLQKEATRYVLLHLATHAVFRRDNPLFSALRLGKDTWLRVMDFYRLRLAGTLVTLSGCETGRHRLLGGDVLGLSRGLFYAGAAALVASLWPAEDHSTAILMERFYGRLVAGETAASALRQAQRDLIAFRDEQGRHPYAHPFYWASFCLLGTPEVRLTASS